MYITMVMVQSLDGKTTDHHNPHIHSWTSKEDQAHFADCIEKNTLIIMGRKTYEVAKPMMRHSPDKLRIVMTHHPEDYQSETISGQLEFTSDSPDMLLKQLKPTYEKILLVGGATINSMFLKENLVDELWLTIEPIVLGKGDPLFTGSVEKKTLQLLTIEKLNAKGTILVKYKVL